MKINVADALAREGEVFTAEYDGVLPDIAYMGDTYRFNGDVHAEISYWYDGEGITVHGRFAAEMLVMCSRCLKEILYPVGFSFTEHYKERPEDGEYPYSGEEIDLSRMFGDNVVMNLPGKFLCSEDCKGLCGLCGHDLNQGACSCGEQIDESNPFYSLSKLYDDEEV